MCHEDVSWFYISVGEFGAVKLGQRCDDLSEIFLCEVFFDLCLALTWCNFSFYDLLEIAFAKLQHDVMIILVLVVPEALDYIGMFPLIHAHNSEKLYFIVNYNLCFLLFDRLLVHYFHCYWDLAVSFLLCHDALIHCTKAALTQRFLWCMKLNILTEHNLTWQVSLHKGIWLQLFFSNNKLGFHWFFFFFLFFDNVFAEIACISTVLWYPARNVRLACIVITVVFSYWYPLVFIPET